MPLIQWHFLAVAKNRPTVCNPISRISPISRYGANRIRRRLSDSRAAHPTIQEQFADGTGIQRRTSWRL
jgi:hypothetical protein